MSNLSDNIESYIKNLLEQSPDNKINVKRSELAIKFNCVPSQINYVLSTRFTEDKGYLVNSRRGGGGYIEIRRIKLTGEQPIYRITELIGRSIPEQEAKGLISRLVDEGVLNNREGDMLFCCVDRENIPVPLPLRDEIRAKMLTSMLLEVFKHKEN